MSGWRSEADKSQGASAWIRGVGERCGCREMRSTRLAPYPGYQGGIPPGDRRLRILCLEVPFLTKAYLG